MTSDATNPPAESMALLPGEKAFLLDLAGQAVSAAVKGQTLPDPRKLARSKGIDLKPRLLKKRGAPDKRCPSKC